MRLSLLANGFRPRGWQRALRNPRPDDGLTAAAAIGPPGSERTNAPLPSTFSGFLIHVGNRCAFGQPIARRIKLLHAIIRLTEQLSEAQGRAPARPRVAFHLRSHSDPQLPTPKARSQASGTALAEAHTGSMQDNSHLEMVDVPDVAPLRRAGTYTWHK